MDKEYISKNRIIILFDYPSKIILLSFTMFSILSLLTKSIIPIFLCIIYLLIVFIISSLILLIKGITKGIIINNENLIVYKNIVHIFKKHEYKVINFKTRGTWKGIQIIEKNIKNEIKCRIWKYEFKKSDWDKIVEDIEKNSFENIYENDLSGLKHSSFFIDS
jgi:hypothetical protein